MRAALAAVLMFLACSACAQKRHCSLTDLDWCDDRNPQLPQQKEIWP